MTEPILSRFDVLCVVKDEVEINSDSALATFVINSHIKNHPDNVKLEKEDMMYERVNNNMLKEDANSKPKEGIPQEILKKYIIYARKYIKPKLTAINNDKITKFYTSLRQESNLSGYIFKFKFYQKLKFIAEFLLAQDISSL